MKKSHLIFVFLIASSTFLFVLPSVSENISDPKLKIALTTTDPVIVITNDLELASYSSSGNGTAINPYIIEYKNITSCLTHAISIGNTTKFFTIRYIHTFGCSKFGKAGIGLYNVSNARIENSTSFTSYYGFEFENVTNSIIVDSLAYDNQNTGFFVNESDLLILNNNTSKLSPFGGYSFKKSTNITVENNVAISNEGYGFYFENSHDFMLLNNVAFQNKQSGFFIKQSSNLILINNYSQYNANYDLWTLDDTLITYKGNSFFTVYSLFEYNFDELSLLAIITVLFILYLYQSKYRYRLKLKLSVYYSLLAISAILALFLYDPDTPYSIFLTLAILDVARFLQGAVLPDNFRTDI